MYVEQIMSRNVAKCSEDTRVTDATTSFFIDVTGTSRRIVSRTLNVLVTSLLVLSPAVRLEQVTVAYPDGDVTLQDPEN